MLQFLVSWQGELKVALLRNIVIKNHSSTRYKSLNFCKSQLGDVAVVSIALLFNRYLLSKSIDMSVKFTKISQFILFTKIDVKRKADN